MKGQTVYSKTKTFFPDTDLNSNTPKPIYKFFATNPVKTVSFIEEK